MYLGAYGAGIAQLVEPQLPKLVVASSSLVARSKFLISRWWQVVYGIRGRRKSWLRLGVVEFQIVLLSIPGLILPVQPHKMTSGWYDHARTGGRHAV